MKNICLSWIGEHDLRADNSGPVIALLKSDFSSFNEVHLLSAYPEDTTSQYKIKLKAIYQKQFEIHQTDIKDPTNYKKIYESVIKLITELQEKHKNNIKWHFHTSPGTSQMSSIWVLLGKTKYSATLYQSWINPKTRKEEVKKPEFPFSVDFFELREMAEGALENIEKTKEFPELSKSIFISRRMLKVVHQAEVLALTRTPTLILGETGTGKEKIARIMHEFTGKKQEKLVTVNCAALPDNLIESELFGYEKGAFTGAHSAQAGAFELADGGTLFLDEIGDLSLNAQAKILRAIELGEIQRLGNKTNSQKRISVLVIAATHKNLARMIEKNLFREDLYYRLSPGMITLPALRERKEDILALSEAFLIDINQTLIKTPGNFKYQYKIFSKDVKNFIVNHNWPGNIRELYHTIRKACLWSKNPEIELSDITDALIPRTEKKKNRAISLSLESSINLEEKLDKIRKKIILKALKLSGSNQTKACKMLGYKNYQTMNNHLKKKTDE